MASTCAYHTIWQKAVNMLQMAQNADENVTGTMAYFGVNLFFFYLFFFFFFNYFDDQCIQTINTKRPGSNSILKIVWALRQKITVSRSTDFHLFRATEPLIKIITTQYRTNATSKFGTGV